MTSPEKGPFSVVPGSHRHGVKAIAGNYHNHRSRTDLDCEHSLADTWCLLGSPGIAFFADQRLAHTGWPRHRIGTQFMLMVYPYE